MQTMRKLVLGALSILAVAVVTSCGFWATGIGGIAKGTTTAIKTSIKIGANLDTLRATANANGFELTVG
jgi:hypothetical protein